MADPVKRKVSSSTNSTAVDSMLSEIIEALEIIKKSQPNGELRIIQERVEKIYASQEDMKEDLRNIKRQLLDPEDGVIVRVNKNTEFRKNHDEDYKEFHKEFESMKTENREFMNFKSATTKAIWIIFTALAGLIVTMILRSLGS